MHLPGSKKPACEGGFLLSGDAVGCQWVCTRRDRERVTLR
jgi:hypothetical protein